MIVQPPGEVDQKTVAKLGRQRSVFQLLEGTLELYQAYPLLFLALACGVIVPYELIVFATTGSGFFSGAIASPGVQLLLSGIEIFVIAPLVSALHVHAVDDVRRGRTPELRSVAVRGLRVLPAVAAATIISTLGMFVGFLLLIVPGVILLLRWYVVAQSAAIDGEGWLPALRRSRALTAGNYGHVAVFGLLVWIIAAAPGGIGGLAFGSHDTGVGSFAVGALVHVFTASVSALATAVLYCDLRARKA